MPGKTEKQFLFEVQLDWLSAKKGMLSAKDAEGSIHVAIPPKFGGEGRPWTPEHLFLGAITSSFMNTYLAFAQKAGFQLLHFDCSTVGQIEIVEGKYRFTIINLYPKIYIAAETLREKATAALEKTHRSCLIANSVHADIFYHSEIRVAPAALETPENTTGSRYDPQNLLL